MPTYEYECKKCSRRFDVFQSMSEDPLSKCPECGGRVQRLIGGGAGIIFKGSGFYVTDSKKGSNGSGKKSDTSEAKSESKSGSATESSDGGKSETKKSDEKKAPVTTTSSGSSGSSDKK
jgi:putative FmdB family regulatory protein